MHVRSERRPNPRNGHLGLRRRTSAPPGVWVTREHNFETERPTLLARSTSRPRITNWHALTTEPPSPVVGSTRIPSLLVIIVLPAGRGRADSRRSRRSWSGPGVGASRAARGPGSLWMIRRGGRSGRFLGRCSLGQRAEPLAHV